MVPDIYLFNPTCELAVANGSSNYMAPAKLRSFERELSALPWILAGPGDLVLVDRKPPLQFTDRLSQAGFAPPSFVIFDEVISDTEFLASARGTLFPWGWSPATHKRLQPLKQGCSSRFLTSPVSEWREIHRELYSRKASLDLLRRFTENYNFEYQLNNDELPAICTSHEQVMSLQQRWENLVVKAPWSSSGRGLQLLRKNEYNQTNRQIISGYLNQQGYVIAGPWHPKVLDLSFQFTSDGNGRIEYQGLSTFLTDSAGRYRGNFLQELPPEIQPEISDFLCSNLPEVIIALQQLLTESDYALHYSGWLGVDALIWRSAGGELKIHPCLEINCRFTMGALAFRLRTHLAENSNGEFRILYGKDGYFGQFCDERMKKDPVIRENGKVVSGFLPLTPAENDCGFGAFMDVKERK